MIPSDVRIFVCTTPQDLRRGFFKLALAARQATGIEPLEGGALFCFVNRRRNRLKVIWWDGTGFCELFKRVHGRLFEVVRSPEGVHVALVDREQFARLIQGVATQSKRSMRTTKILH